MQSMQRKTKKEEVKEKEKKETGEMVLKKTNKRKVATDTENQKPRTWAQDRKLKCDVKRVVDHKFICCQYFAQLVYISTS